MESNANKNRETKKHGDENESHRQIIQTPRRDNNLIIPPPSDWLNRYNKLLDRYPLRTKMCTSFLVSAFGSTLGSYLSSSATEGREKLTRRDGNSCKSMPKPASTTINWVDVFSYAIHGALINAPISHFWFEWLSVNGPSSNTASVLVDQLVVQPPLLVLMFVCLDVLRASIRATIHQFKYANVVSKSVTNALQVVPNSWRFWPFAVYFTFKYLKKKHYTVALNLCSVAWTVYLSRGAGAGDGSSADS
mmetsp:Transcript_22532/g.54474  ORF Transcript_22532/g.54474 Transcript_22532/m.54474 type:complete len:248 (-) Transcript_22532:1022-1765(-)